MANKINVKLILELRKANMSRNEIAATRHISKNSVSEVIHLSDDLGITYDDVADIDADTVYRMFYPDKYATELLYTNPDYEYVHNVAAYDISHRNTCVVRKTDFFGYSDNIQAARIHREDCQRPIDFMVRINP